MNGCAEGLFYQFVQKLSEIGEIEFESMFVDGTSTDKGILLRMNRSIQVEGAFGVLKQDYGFRRFLTRGKTNNETRLFILAIAFNIRKLCSRLADGRFGKALFEPKTA